LVWRRPSQSWAVAGWIKHQAVSGKPAIPCSEGAGLDAADRRHQRQRLSGARGLTTTGRPAARLRQGPRSRRHVRDAWSPADKSIWGLVNWPIPATSSASIGGRQPVRYRARRRVLQGAGARIRKARMGISIANALPGVPRTESGHLAASTGAAPANARGRFQRRAPIKARTCPEGFSF